MKAKYLVPTSAFAAVMMATAANAQTFSNPGAITIPDSGAATPYPSTILVAGMGAGPWDVNVTLSGLSHTFPADLDILLVNPSGGTVMLMSDQGGSTDVVGISLTFSDGSPQLSAPLVTGTFGPNSVAQSDIMPAPAPVGPYGTLLNPLGAGAVNGTWSLYINDDAGGDVGSISGGWSITFSAVPAPGALALLGLAGMIGGSRRRR